MNINFYLGGNWNTNSRDGFLQINNSCVLRYCKRKVKKKSFIFWMRSSCSHLKNNLKSRIFPQSRLLHSTAHFTVHSAYYLNRSDSTLTCLHANHQGASCVATGSRHNKNQPTKQPSSSTTTTKATPTWLSSFHRRRGRGRERIGRRDDRWKSSCDSQGVLH